MSISKQGESTDRGLANLKISLNLKDKPFGIPSNLERGEIIEENHEKEDLNESDLINLEGLRESLTKKEGRNLCTTEKKINVSRDSADE